MERRQRRLAAILAADVVGYSRLMAADESGTLARFSALRAELLDTKIAQFNGRVVGTAGDSLLVEFASAVDAVQCAVEAQERIAAHNADIPEDRRIVFRMGVNLGDVIAEGGTIHGDGVNVAARLERLAEPGTVVVGHSIHDQVTGKLPYSFADLGEFVVKNIPTPLRAYRVECAVGVSPPSPAHAQDPFVPSKPSIAVLPFNNMSGDPEQEYFADGMAEEILTALSRFNDLFVIARNSSFAYKGRAVNVKQIGHELGVRYVLEGSVRKALSKVRITGQLIDATTGAHLWAERFDGGIEDIFDLQDQVTARVVGAIAPRVERAEIERTKSKPTESLDAYDYFLRGMADLHAWSREGNEAALAHFHRAIEIDPGYASALGLAARAYVQKSSGGWVRDRPRELAEAESLARRAIEHGYDNAVALCMAGFALSDFVGNVDEGAAYVDRALDLNPNLAWAWLYGGWIKASVGDSDGAMAHIGRAMRLSPNDPQDFSAKAALAFAHFIAGRYVEAASNAEAALRSKPNYLLANCIGAASEAMLGRVAGAQRLVDRIGRIAPDLRVSNVGELQLVKRPDDLARWIEGLRKAGLPE